MATTKQTLEADIRGTEKAVRLLIGERKATTSKLARLQAHLKLDQAKLAALTRPRGPAVLAAASRFPDVSSFQASVNVPAVRQGSSARVGSLLVTKLTEGLSFVDRLGVQRMHQISGARFPLRGSYHFGHSGDGGVAQAEFYLKACQDNQIVLRENDLVIYDCEVTDGQPARTVAQAARDFATTIRAKAPAKVTLVLYGGGPFLSENGVTLDGYDAHLLAAYVSNPAPFRIFGARTKYWQYTDGVNGPNPHACPGIGACDMSIVL